MVFGNMKKNILVIALIFVFVFSASAYEAHADSTRRVAVVMFNFQDNTQQPYTTDYAKSMATTIGNFYKEASFGRLSLSIDTFGWYNIPYTSSVCNYDVWSNAVDQKAAQAGINLGGYDNVIYVFPYTASCGWTGLSQYNGKKSWNNGRFTLGVAAHEFGHSLGMDHSNTYRCFDATGARVAVSSNCRSYEYTDPYDIMGSGTYSTNSAAHFNNFQKGSMGWLANTQTVTTGGTYTVYADEIQTNSVQSLRIRRSDGQFYYLEYRTPYGFDNYWRFQGTSPASNGVSIRLAPDYTKGAHSYLIDTTPDTLSFEDAPLLIGKTFTDDVNHISVTAVSRTTNSITVQINLGSVPPPAPAPSPTCTRRNPTLGMSVYSRSTTGVQYSVNLKNNDDSLCGSSTFSVTPALSSGLVQTPRWVSVNNLPPGNSITFRVTVNGTSGTVTEKAVNTLATSYSATTSISYP